jgi:hypothetical protein
MRGCGSGSSVRGVDQGAELARKLQVRHCSNANQLLFSHCQRAAIYSNRIDNTCKFCVVDETDFHLFCMASKIPCAAILSNSLYDDILQDIFTGTFGMQGTTTGSTSMNYRLNHEVQADIAASICLCHIQV